MPDESSLQTEGVVNQLVLFEKLPERLQTYLSKP